jgi:pyruvate/2-oxoglutarate dehydrogenase complex dihydrolipoamide acyltransferase (E2) component
VSTIVRIPKLGVTMTEGTITEWAVADGAQIGDGDVLYVLETDKTQTEVPSPASGAVRLIGAVGETYPVGTPVAEIG